MLTKPSRSKRSLAPARAISRRSYLLGSMGGALAFLFGRGGSQVIAAAVESGVVVQPSPTTEDLFEYIQRIEGTFDLTLYRQLLGTCNEFKEGDQSQGIAAADDQSLRTAARSLLANTRIADLEAHPVFEDAQWEYIDRAVDAQVAKRVEQLDRRRAARFLLTATRTRSSRSCPASPATPSPAS